MTLLTRRQTLFAGGIAGGGLMLSGCSQVLQADRLTANASFQRVMAAAEGWSLAAQRFLIGGGRLAREFKPSDISPNFKANGTLHPGGDDYARALDMMLTGERIADMDAAGLDVAVACPRAPRSPATTAWRAGAPSASGRACRSASS